MTTPTRTSTEHATAFGAEDFTTGEGLRALLHRLAEGGEDAWVHDPVARDLMEFAADKYRALARKHKLDTWEAVTAAFDAMQCRSTREANDPWAIITHAVRITCVYEERAQGLLCSVHQARRAHVSAFHDPERFSERDTALADYHPAFHTTDLRPSDLEPERRESLGSAQACMSAGSAAEDAIAMLCLLDWPTDTARAAVEHVCGALMKAGTRQSAYETLRRDRHARALLDLPRRSWAALLKALLGNPHPAYVATSSGRGILLRLLLGETLDLLLRDDDLILALGLAAPSGGGGESS
ncbi:hypothetical protein M3G03_12595 [Aestuariimicrobium sp. p3-SID1156]|uniref:hypothetical protein n=1 Tax=Aestuariimicrobium sp. p3-SID1156 TaxID=2916038 RepID=UPI00223AF9FA|nr:hypothetical protein [Aestuariimicrobium sp. p3-SID1156]MCT1460368.1 hypothetical protein [Aestuariimicrobium sp. p3-SID1156]